MENNIASDSYDLSLSTEMDKQGFPALDYLLNGVKDSDLEILNVYNDLELRCLFDSRFEQA